MERFDQATLQETARLVSVEGMALVERQTIGLFGKISDLQRWGAVPACDHGHGRDSHHGSAGSAGSALSTDESHPLLVCREMQEAVGEMNEIADMQELVRKLQQAVVEDNYFAFNDYSYRGRYTVGSWSKGERLEHNTVLYNGDWGVYKPASGYSTLSHNLVVATNYLGVWHDTAVFHVMCAPRASATALGEGGVGR